MEYLLCFCIGFIIGFFMSYLYNKKPIQIIDEKEIYVKTCTCPDKYFDAYYDCKAIHHPEWFSDKKYHFGAKEDCKVCKWNIKNQ